MHHVMEQLLYVSQQSCDWIKVKNGAEILMHVGIDTVNLQGKYFSPQVQVNEEVKKGQLLLNFDLEKSKKKVMTQQHQLSSQTQKILILFKLKNNHQFNMEIH